MATGAHVGAGGSAAGRGTGAAADNVALAVVSGPEPMLPQLPPLAPAAPVAGSGGMRWPQAGMIVWTFAAPSAIMAVPYAIGMAGFVGGTLVCLIVTAATVGGSLMLLQLKLLYPSCQTFGDLGLQALGRYGQIWGNAVQLCNFCLFLPCALQFCALALMNIGTGIPGFHGCDDYHVFLIAGVCLLTTQVRTLNSTFVFSCLSFVSTCAMGIIMIYAALAYDNPRKVPAQWFGNPDQDPLTGFITAAGGVTIVTWSYVPAFLTVELTSCMEDPRTFSKSLGLSAVLTVLMFLVVGVVVVARWGFHVGEVVVATAGVDAWRPGSATNTVFNSFQLVGNFVSYMLDSVPLGRFCQKSWAPHFKDTWASGDVLRYLGYTLPTFLFGLALVIFVPSINTLLDFTTACTSPMVSHIYPAVLYWKVFCTKDPRAFTPRDPDAATPLGAADGANGTDGCQTVRARRRSPPCEAAGVVLVFLVGCACIVACFVKAVGYLASPTLRPRMQIGCDSWLIWSDGGR